VTYTVNDGGSKKALELKKLYTWTTSKSLFFSHLGVIDLDSIDGLFQVRGEVHSARIMKNFQSAHEYGVDVEDLITVVEYFPGRYFMTDGTHRCIAQWLDSEQNKKAKPYQVCACILSPKM
jgi:hypothetical protein